MANMAMVVFIIVIVNFSIASAATATTTPKPPIYTLSYRCFPNGTISGRVTGGAIGYMAGYCAGNTPTTLYNSTPTPTPTQQTTNTSFTLPCSKNTSVIYVGERQLSNASGVDGGHYASHMFYISCNGLPAIGVDKTATYFITAGKIDPTTANPTYKISMAITDMTTKNPVTSLMLGNPYSLIISGPQSYGIFPIECIAAITSTDTQQSIYDDGCNCNPDVLSQFSEMPKSTTHNISATLYGFHFIQSTSVYLECTVKVCDSDICKNKYELGKKIAGKQVCPKDACPIASSKTGSKRYRRQSQRGLHKLSVRFDVTDGDTGVSHNSAKQLTIALWEVYAMATAVLIMSLHKGFL